ncbi:MAG: glycosyltransferase N-terminal domain-containing protein, partial [Pseudomonadota bacterium]
RSFRRWRWANGFAKALIGAFEVCLAQDGDHLRRFQALGISWAATAGNLKFAAAPLPVDEEERTAVTEALDGRAVWLAASTHPGEEDIAGAVHLAARRDHPRLLTIIAPRHPERAERIINALAPRGLQISQRSTGDAIAADTDIYLADTIGEMGLLYRLCDVVFVGGSLVPHGGHNPLEPAKLGAAIITGPHMENFADIARQMSACEGVSTVADQTALARVVTQTLADGSLRNRLKAAAADVVEAQKGVLDDLMRHLEPVLPKSDNR